MAICPSSVKFMYRWNRQSPYTPGALYIVQFKHSLRSWALIPQACIACALANAESESESQSEHSPL